MGGNSPTVLPSDGHEITKKRFESGLSDYPGPVICIWQNATVKLMHRVPRPSGKLLRQVLHYSGGRPSQTII